MPHPFASLTCALLTLLVPGQPDSRPPATASTAAADPPAAVVAAYAAPLAGQLTVIHPFRAPPTPYAAGHRGVDLGAQPGATVRAAGAGRVVFAGQVAGRGVVVTEHPDGVSTEYEPVTPLVAAGSAVARGQPLGVVRGRHGDCPPDRCLHWGARRAGRYFDPLTLLRSLGPVRLLPWTTAPPDPQARG